MANEAAERICGTCKKPIKRGSPAVVTSPPIIQLAMGVLPVWHHKNCFRGEIDK